MNAMMIAAHAMITAFWTGLTIFSSTAVLSFLLPSIFPAPLVYVPPGPGFRAEGERGCFLAVLSWPWGYPHSNPSPRPPNGG
jgi:hypothetical protein